MPEPTDTPPPSDHEEELSGVGLALRELAEKSKAGTREDRPARLPLKAVVLCEAAFRVRGEALAEHHLSDLCRALKSVDDLDPVTVMPCGNSFVLMDGHHRLEAHRRTKGRNDIPVRYFEGSPEEAVLEACRANAQAVLPLNNHQRQNLGWRLVLTGRYSKKQIVANAGISNGQVAAMRRVKRKLEADAYTFDSWWQARQAADGNTYEELSEDEMEVWIDEQAQVFADRLAKACSTKLAQNPVVAARALEHYFGRKLPDVLAELISRNAPEVDDDDDLDEDF